MGNAIYNDKIEIKNINLIKSMNLNGEINKMTNILLTTNTT